MSVRLTKTQEQKASRQANKRNKAVPFTKNAQNFLNAQSFLNTQNFLKRKICLPIAQNRAQGLYASALDNGKAYRQGQLLKELSVCKT